MLITLLIVAVKNILKRRKGRKSPVPKFSIIAFLVIAITVMNAQEKKMSFAVWKNKSQIGTIDIVRSQQNMNTVFDLFAEINTRFIFRYNIVGIERTVFKNGKLSYSSIMRICNNKVKVNKELTKKNEYYLLKDGKKTSKININGIERNLVTLYYSEPKNVTEVYCDNQQSMGKVVRLKDHIYKVILPDGNYSVFYYKNNRCERVKVFNLLYKVELISI